ncbi:MAG: ROK family protein [Myxococcales bacterium]|nr:ROK family protein [Myxococcales bacterium]
MDSQTLRLGVDLGGTKIEIIALVDGVERHRERVPTPRDDYAETLAAVAGLVARAEATVGLRGTVGVGIPGALSPVTGRVKNANSTWLIGQPFDQDLAARLGRPVRVQNDANCFAVSEATDGAAAGAPVVFGVILGTGVGAGVALEGRALTGANAIAGEWGHNPLPWPADDERPGAACYCGRHGCLETWLSGRQFAHRFQEVTGLAWDSRRIVAEAQAGHAAAAQAFDRYCDRLARGLAHVINVLDPDVIVLGGGMSNARALYAEVPRRWGAYVFSDVVQTRLVPPAHGDSSGVRGAAWLWGR